MEKNPVGELHFCREDIVESVLKPSKIGTVMKVAGDPDSSSESSDSDDDDDDIGEGCAKVCWSNSDETTEELSDLRVVDRAFMHGDIVALGSNPLGQTGIIVAMEMYVDLEYPSGEVVRNVSSRNLRRVRSFMSDDYVIHDHWIGRVTDVIDNVTVKFSDGAKCRIARADPSRLKPMPDNHSSEDSDCPYYPGLRVRASSSFFKGAKWLNGTWKSTRLQGIVTEVETGAVMVFWLGVGNACSLFSSPPEQQYPENLTRLLHFSHMSWQFGDRSLPPTSLSTAPASSLPHSDHASSSLPPSDDGDADADSEPVASNDYPAELPQPSSSSISALHRRKSRRCTVKRDKRKLKKKDEAYERAVVIVKTKTFADVIWQDGSRSEGIATSTLVPVHHLGDNDFFPEQYVIERGTDEKDETEVRKVGIIKSVDATERTARIRWLKPVNSAEEPREFDKEEVISVYEIAEHHDYSYSLGDIVIRLDPTVEAVQNYVDQSRSSTDRTHCSTDGELDADSYLFRKGKRQRKGKVSDRQDLSWVGAIIGVEDGDIEVEWANGMVSKVGPQAIFVVSRDDEDDDESASSGEDYFDDAASWETVDSDQQLESQETTVQREECGDNEEREKEKEEEEEEEEESKQRASKSEDEEGSHHSASSGALAFPRAALSLVSKFAAGFFGLNSKKDKGGPAQNHLLVDDEHRTEKQEKEESSEEEEEEEEKESSEEEEYSHKEGTLSKEMNALDISSTVIPSATSSGLSAFKHFDIVSDASDHNFIGESNELLAQRKWLRKVQDEWSLLEKNLPDAIFVRVFEDRMDLLRAIIVGADGTPYHDGLFVFDIYLPPEYPTIPPVVHYHSGGLKLNPNLYENGKVCLSLLNTWQGRGTEVWNAGTSSLLQVLVSLQGLVLNAKPYFNEAGYERQIGSGEGEKNSVVYNENCFLLSCKSMLYLIRRPPKHCEEMIRAHFRERGERLMSVCKEYVSGVPVPIGSVEEESNENSASAGFKLMLSKLIPLLSAAFMDINM